MKNIKHNNNITKIIIDILLLQLNSNEIFWKLIHSPKMIAIIKLEMSIKAMFLPSIPVYV